ncbi:MAG: hypothetical protein LW817_02645, partial [Candidatus Caenarcaniphilales bacterium]|nr:hypothetical protein [Candidatus Caenarcaniphilales bacterium]
TTNGYIDVSLLNSYDGAVDIFAMDKNGMSGTITTETHGMHSVPHTHSHSAYTIAIKGAGGGGGGGCGTGRTPRFVDYSWNGGLWGEIVSTAIVDKVSGVVTDDLMIAMIIAHSESVSITPPAGWTLMQSNIRPFEDDKISLYYKVASSSEPDSYNFGLSPSADYESFMYHYNGTSSTSPVSASATVNGTYGAFSFIPYPNLSGFTANNHYIGRLGFHGNGDDDFHALITVNGYTQRTASEQNPWISLHDKNNVSGNVPVEIANLNPDRPPHGYTTFTFALSNGSDSCGGGGGGGADYPGCAKENGGTLPPNPPNYIDATLNGSDVGSIKTASTIAKADKPNSVVQNDLMVAVILAENQNADLLTPPTGWTFISSNLAPYYNYFGVDLGKYRSTVYYKIAGSGEPNRYDFNFDESTFNTAYLIHYNGTSLSSPIAAYATANGIANSTSDINLPALNSFSANQNEILRIGFHGDEDGCTVGYTTLTTNGYTQIYGVSPTCEGDFYIPVDGSIWRKSISSGNIPAEKIDVNVGRDPTPFVSFTLAIAPPGSSGGGSGNYTFPQSFTPDPNSMVMWQGVFDNNGDVGDVSAEINSGSSIKEFKLIDFDGIQNNQDPEFNGLTLNGLAANRLVITDSNKKLSTTSSVILNNNNVGISSLSPSSKLDVAALMTTKTFQIKSGAVNNYILRSDINGDSSWVAGSSVFNSAAGNNMEVQFNSAGVFAGNPNLTWASSRLNASNFSVDNGSSSVPRYTFSGSNTSGVFSFSNNHLDYTSAGVHTISLDANGNVGLRNNSPVARLDINGSLAFKSPALINLTSVSTIPNSHGFIRVQGSGAPVQLSSSPQISTGADGQLMVLKGSHNT